MSSPHEFLAFNSREDIDAFLKGFAPRVRAMWLAGASLEGICNAMPLHIVYAASCLAKMDDADLLAGLRTRLAGITGE